MTPDPLDPLWMPPAETEAAMLSVMAETPDLTDHGFGVPLELREKPEDRLRRFQRERAHLLLPNALNEFERARTWLSRQPRQKRVSRRWSSYGLKHVAEEAVGYASNGVFIAAAISLGFRVEREGTDACLNINPRAIPRAA